MPLSQEGGIIKVIMHDPNDFETVDKLRFVLNREIEVALAPKQADRRGDQPLLRRATKETESVDSMLQEFTDTAIDYSDEGGGGGAGMGKANILEEGDAPIIRLVHLIIQEAVTSRASDIHIEPFVDRVRIRYRIDGVLMERDSPPGDCSHRSSRRSRSWVRSTSPRSDGPRTVGSRSPSPARTSTCA